MKHLSKVMLASVLSLSLFTYGCSPAQFFAVLNEVAPAIVNILQIIAIFTGHPANTVIASKVGADVASVEKLYSDYQAANTTDKPGIRDNINTGFQVLQADLSTVYSVAQVSDPNTQAKVAALIALVKSSVGIAEAIISPKASAAPTTLDADKILDSYNKILVAKTGVARIDAATPHMKLHKHSTPVRVLTLGYAH